MGSGKADSEISPGEMGASPDSPDSSCEGASVDSGDATPGKGLEVSPASEVAVFGREMAGLPTGDDIGVVTME